MKKIFALTIALLMAVCMASCGSAPAANDTTTTTTKSDATTAATKVEQTNAAASSDSLSVAFGDYDAQETLSRKIQNGEIAGATVEIEGTVKKIGSSYSIGQVKDGTFTGTKFSYNGDYPAENSHVKLVGTVVSSGIVFSIEAKSIEVVE